MAALSLTTATDLFKINYYKKSENMYNSANILQGRIKKRHDFTGRQRFVSTPLSFSGGVGAGSLPTANVADYDGAVIESNKVYAVVSVDRESIKAAEDDKGAFVRATKETVQKGVESYMRNASRILFGDSTGVLGKGDGTGANVSGPAGGPWVMTFPNDADLWKEANWEENDLVNVVTGLAADNSGGTAESALLEVTAVDESARTVTVAQFSGGTSARLDALTGVGPLASTDGLVIQNSYNQEPQGLRGILDATSGSLYNIPVQRRWQAGANIDAAGAGVTPDRMNQTMLQVEKRFGRAPNLIMTSYTQFRKILDFLEDHKRYPIKGRNGDLKGKISFNGVEFMSTRGPVGIFVDRFCEDDRIYFLNDNFIECHHRPGHGWFDDDGTVFLRSSSSDEYEARYGGYYENFITPSAHGVLKGLAI